MSILPKDCIHCWCINLEDGHLKCCNCQSRRLDEKAQCVNISGGRT